MSYTYTSRAEYEEYTNIMKILRNKCKELNYLTKVIENIPHIEVITDNSILNIAFSIDSLSMKFFLS